MRCRFPRSDGRLRRLRAFFRLTTRITTSAGFSIFRTLPALPISLTTNLLRTSQLTRRLRRFSDENFCGGASAVKQHPAALRANSLGPNRAPKLPLLLAARPIQDLFAQRVQTVGDAVAF